MKKNFPLRLYAFVAAALLTTMSCSKKDDTSTTPEEEKKPETYLLQTITSTTASGTKVDSFVYNAQNQLLRIYVMSRMTQQFSRYQTFTYDAAGRVVKKEDTGIKADKTEYLHESDSLVWKDGKISVFQHLPTSSIPYEKIYYEVNSNGQATMLGSKDSIIWGNVIRYTEFTYNGKDVVKSLYFAQSTNEPTPTTTTTTYTYDNKISPFYSLYRNNPILELYTILISLDILPSEHNLLRKEIGSTICTFENTYDEKNGLLIAQKAITTYNSGPSETNTKFKYIKAK
ncbi:hypothetical protein [Chitinophaga sp. HK235]|uniref:hypothetical protein n=1 Tax=Chitinophaga sp. HK235 TaxID=2952571 RepID=UPI001BA4BF37|nr:hypothetical protein [Chitinophaga sp. HK235]